VLEIQNLQAAYGGISALNGVSLCVRKDEFISIVGPNGAGKTTLFKTVSGIVPARAGRIVFEGRDLLLIPPHERAHLGIAHVPEGRQVFASLSVEENLQMGAYTETGRRDWAANLNYILKLFPILNERFKERAGVLSGGEQQMLAIARGLASSPKLLMLDEPSMGLAPAIADAIFEAVVDIRRERGLSVLLVEQRAVEALENCDRGYVLETGRVVLEGQQKALLSNDRVRQAYLGM
jgi:branched-chain amino acid transport system ATP-binding protein